jgi:glycosyltransferase involved in cell wall biosynthesis
MTAGGASPGDGLPLVSAILPVYNGERYLAETLDCLLGQTYPALEVIAVNDGSTDRSQAILDGYRERFGGRLGIATIPNSGVSTARNTGVEMAKGFYVAFIDQDDLWSPDKVARQVDALLRSRLRISFTNSATIDAEGRMRMSRLRRFPGGDAVNWFEQVLFDPIVAISSVMMERSLFLEAGGFSPGLTISEDYDLLLRILWRERAEALDEPLLRYRDHRGSNTYTRVDTLLREIAAVHGWWKTRHPEIFRNNRGRYAVLRWKLRLLRLKAML